MPITRISTTSAPNAYTRQRPSEAALAPLSRTSNGYALALYWMLSGAAKTWQSLCLGEMTIVHMDVEDKLHLQKTKREAVVALTVDLREERWLPWSSSSCKTMW
jgi:hypothetical protein